MDPEEVRGRVQVFLMKERKCIFHNVRVSGNLSSLSRSGWNESKIYRNRIS